MTTVVSADDWPLALLCLIVAVVLFIFTPGIAVVALIIGSILIYVFRRKAREGYEDAMKSE